MARQESSDAQVASEEQILNVDQQGQSAPQQQMDSAYGTSVGVAELRQVTYTPRTLARESHYLSHPNENADFLSFGTPMAPTSPFFGQLGVEEPSQQGGGALSSPYPAAAFIPNFGDSLMPRSEPISGSDAQTVRYHQETGQPISGHSQIYTIALDFAPAEADEYSFPSSSEQTPLSQHDFQPFLLPFDPRITAPQQRQHVQRQHPPEKVPAQPGCSNEALYGQSDIELQNSSASQPGWGSTTSSLSEAHDILLGRVDSRKSAPASGSNTISDSEPSLSTAGLARKASNRTSRGGGRPKRALSAASSNPLHPRRTACDFCYSRKLRCRVVIDEATGKPSCRQCIRRNFDCVLPKQSISPSGSSAASRRTSNVSGTNSISGGHDDEGDASTSSLNYATVDHEVASLWRQEWVGLPSSTSPFEDAYEDNDSALQSVAGSSSSTGPRP